MYTFKPGELVAIVSQASGKIVDIRRVDKVLRGVVVLDDESRWYATGLSVAADRNGQRMTVLLPGMSQQLHRQGRLLRLAEMATIVYESAQQASGLTDADLEKAEKALLDVLRVHVRSRDADQGRAFLTRVKERVTAAERAAVDTLLKR